MQSMVQANYDWLDVAFPTIERTVRLRPGERVRFGRGSATDADLVDIVLSNDRRVSAVAGQITLQPHRWAIENFNRFLTMRVIDTAGRGLRDLAPQSAAAEGRTATIVDWASARLELRLSAGERIDIRISSSGRSPAWVMPIDGYSETLPSSSVDRTRLYFFTLLVLCEPQLRDASSVIAPTDAEICERLRASGLDPIATEKMVERRLVDARRHLGLGPGASALRAVPKSSLRPLLIDTAIATGAVRRADLELIDFGS